MLGRLKTNQWIFDTNLKRGWAAFVAEATANPVILKPVEVVWKPPVLPSPWENATWLYYLYCRINSPKADPKNKFQAEKLHRFVQYAHTDMVRYVEQYGPWDKDLDVDRLCSLYRQLGPSHYPDDKHLIRVTYEEHKLKQTPLEVIRAAYPNMKWTPEEIPIIEYDPTRYYEYIDGEWAPVIQLVPKTHQLYLGVIFVLNQCQTVMDQHREHGGPIFDALWAYYCSWVPFFEYVAASDDDVSDQALLTPGNNGLSPWDIYGTLDTRAFHAGDLPDLFHVLVSIPLWGEQNAPPFKIGKILQKCLPFACQRRHLIKSIYEAVYADEAFWRLVSKLFWVALAGLYPGKLAPTKNKLGMRELLRIKELTGSRDKLMAALTKDQPKFGNTATGNNNGGPLIMFTPFRLYVLYMASFNPHYVEMARRCINWDYFETDAIDLADIIREQNLFPDDPFAQARKRLSKTAKSPSSKVHRFRRKSKAITIMEQMNTTLEKTVLKDMHDKLADLEILEGLTPDPDGNWKETFKTTSIGKRCSEPYTVENLQMALEICKKAKPFFNTLVKVTTKSAILNALLQRIPPDQRLTYRAFCLLALPEYGGIEPASVQLMVELVRVYHDKAVPKEFTYYINMFRAKDFMIACYYFTMVAVLEKFSFVTLDAETTRRIDEAMMTKKHAMFPGQKIPESVYNISIALCCDRICTIMGSGKYGDSEVAYDTQRQMFVCVHGRQIRKKEGEGEDEGKDDEQEGGGDDEDSDEDLPDDEGDKDSPADGINDDDAVNLEDLMAAPAPQIDLDRLFMGDIVAQSAAMKGKGVKRSKEMIARKMVRNQRKAYSKVPCGQPVISFSLRGKALVWGNTLENKVRYMFCPECASLHMYSILNYAGGDRYRCPECARKELYHLEFNRCAYCDRASTQIKLTLEVFHPMDPNGDFFKRVHFCRGHYNSARKYAYRGIPKDVLWKMIAKEQEKKTLMIVSGKWLKGKK